MGFIWNGRDSRAMRPWLVCGASALALCLAGQAQAQDTSDEEQNEATTEAPPQGEAIVVTGSRLRTDGMQAPVPVTVIQAETLQAASPDTLITAVSQLPQFYGNQTPNSGNFFLRSGYGSLNLRGLGVNRTLTLLNGRRMPASSAFGGVDINLFPEAMIQSVETVTGGASAAYGSDAVAGVVNFILDTNYTGLDLKAQVGATDRNDAENWKVSGSFGMDLGDRAHLMVSGEYFDQSGVVGYGKRDWYEAWGTLGSGTAASPFVFSPYVISRNASFDGVISAPGTAIDGLAFDRNGNTSPFITCSPAQAGPRGIPPARHVALPGANCSGDDLGAYTSLYPDLKRYSLFGYFDYDLTDNLSAYVQYIRGRTKTKSFNTPRGSFGGTPTALTIFQDNAYLPDSVRQTMIANNIQSFNLRRMGSPEDIGRDYYLDDRTTQDIGTAGLTYDISGGMFDGWRAEAFYQYGRSLRDWRQNGLRVDRIFAATDAVRDPATGQIVCRVSLFGNAFPGCQPINLFGRGNASEEAIDYVIGFEPGQQITTPLFFADSGFARGETYDYTTGEAKRNLTTFKQQQAEFSLSGDLFEGWAGPVAVALGAAYRKETIRQIVQDVTNPSSNHETGHPVLCNGQAPGLRGVSGPDCANTVGVQYSKVSNIRGSSTVKEAFGELLVPLISGQFVTEAAANGAVRYADYSGSGGIWAYKGGLEIEFVDSLRLRGTYSRDVRAGNLSERFDKTGGTATVTDPAFGGQTVTITRFSGGNPAIAPEKADTYTLGAVFQPAFAPGLSMSVDWYDIKLKDAISQVGNQEVVNRCFAGDPTFCALVTRDPTTNALTLVGDVFVNVAQSRVSGIDAELSYHTDANLFGHGDEALGMRLFASWLTERSETDFRGTTIDYAGQTGARQSDGVYFAYPDFKATGNLTYRVGGASVFLQGRYFGKGKQDLTPTNILADNKVSAVFYTDLNLAYEFPVSGSEAEVFFNINNLFDAAPPVTPSYSAFLGYSTQVNTALYDVLGRRYTVGIKFKM